MNNRGSVQLSKKTYLIIGGTMLGIILVAWVLLITGIFKKNKNPNNVQVGVYDIPKVPEGYQLVFQQTAEYTVTEDGKRVLEWTAEYDQAGNKVKTVYYDEDGKVSETFLYTYDEKGRVATSQRLDENQRETRSEYWEYDEDGRETVSGYKITKYEGLGSVQTGTQKKRYDSNGELSIEETEISVSGGEYSSRRITKREYYQDADGKREVTTEINEKDDKVEEYVTEKVWDSAGRLTAEGVKYEPSEKYTENEIYYYDYDENGNLVTERVQYGESEKTVIIQENTYSEQGILKEKVDFYHNGDFRERSIYDEKGRLIKTVREDGKVTEEGILSEDGSWYELYWTQYTRDGSELYLAERIEYDESGRMKSREKIKTSSSRDGVRVYVKEEYDTEGTVISTETWEHPKDSTAYRTERREYGQGGNSGNVVRGMIFQPDGTLDWDLHYEYDENGELVKLVQYHEDHFDSWVEYELLERAEGKHPWIKMIYKNEDGSVWKYTERTLSQMGEGYHDSRISYNPDGTIMPDSESYSYEYDQYDNPIRRIEYPEGKPVVTEEYLYKPFVVPADKKAGE